MAEHAPGARGVDVPKPYRGFVARAEWSCLPMEASEPYEPGPGEAFLDEPLEKRLAVPKRHCGTESLPESCCEPTAEFSD